MKNAKDCELCKTKDEDYRVLLKDQYAFSILILEPLKKFHFMVIPTRHVTSLGDLTKEESQSIFHFLDKLENAILKATGESPIVGIHRGQHPTQPHIHIHIFPSQGSLRDLVSNFEKVEFREKAKRDDLSKIKDEILEFL